jgi:hypothetical protein
MTSGMGGPKESLQQCSKGTLEEVVENVCALLLPDGDDCMDKLSIVNFIISFLLSEQKRKQERQRKNQRISFAVVLGRRSECQGSSLSLYRPHGRRFRLPHAPPRDPPSEPFTDTGSVL